MIIAPSPYEDDILACIFCDERLLQDPRLQDDMFVSPLAADTFRIMKRVKADKAPVNIYEIGLRSDHSDYVAGLTNRALSSASFDYYLGKVDEARNRRRLALVSRRIDDQIETMDPAVLAQEVQEALRPRSLNSTWPLILPGSTPLMVPEWIVKGILEADALAVLYGDPAVGKSFFALDLAASIATGTAFHGRPVKKTGPAVYIAGEGFAGIQRRIAAWGIRHGWKAEQIPLAVSRQPAVLCDEGTMATVADSIEAFAMDAGPPSIIAVDTWSRNLGGDENSSLDAAAAVAALDRLRGRFPGCAVLVVHHSGQADKSRARGSSVLRAAADLEISATKDPDGIITATCTKSKDAEPFPPLAFRIADVDLGILDEDGQAVSSAVLETTEVPGKIEKPTGRNIDKALRILACMIDEQTKRGEQDPRVPIDAWRRACDAEGMIRPRFHEASRALVRGRLVFIEDDCARLP